MKNETFERAKELKETYAKLNDRLERITRIRTVGFNNLKLDVPSTAEVKFDTFTKEEKTEFLDLAEAIIKRKKEEVEREFKNL